MTNNNNIEEIKDNVLELTEITNTMYHLARRNQFYLLPAELERLISESQNLINQLKHPILIDGGENNEKK